MPARFEPPDVLVLAGGGLLGEAWMSGVLAGLEDATGHDFRRTEAFVGTSAGSLVAAALVAGERPRRPRANWPAPVAHLGCGGEEVAASAPGVFGALAALRPRVAAETVARGALSWAAAFAAPLAPVALSVSGAGWAPLRAAVLAGVNTADPSLREVRERVDSSGARFDGRLRVTAVDRITGARVVFGAPGAPPAAVGEAVQASCSVPWLFAPVTIGGREYVDGGVWSATNIDVAPAGRDTRVLCLNPAASLQLALSSPLGMLRAIGGTRAHLESLALLNRGAHVRMVGPEGETARVMGADLMDARLRDAVLAGGYSQGVGIGGG